MTRLNCTATTELQHRSDDIEIILMHIPCHGIVSTDLLVIFSVLEDPSTKLILAGHNHKNDAAEFEQTENQKLTQVQTGAFGRDPINNWRQIRLTKDQIIVSLPGKVENEFVIQAK